MRRELQTTENVSVTRDASDDARLSVLIGALVNERDSLRRAALASQIRDCAERVVAFSIRDANCLGRSWREIGTSLGVAFQTLYRRYGESPERRSVQEAAGTFPDREP